MGDKYVIKNGGIIEGFLLDSTLLDIQGVNGQVFSITDNLVGDIFRVSDITGIPILNINSDSTVKIDGSLIIGNTNTLSTNYGIIVNNDISSIKLESPSYPGYVADFISDPNMSDGYYFKIKYSLNDILSSNGQDTVILGSNSLILGTGNYVDQRNDGIVNITNLGVNINYIPLTIYSDLSTNEPRNFGVEQPGISLRLGNVANSPVLDFGCGSDLMWLQSTNKYDLSQNFPLNINPNGGIVNVYDTLNPNIIKSSDNLPGGNIINISPTIELSYTGSGTYSNVKTENSIINITNDGDLSQTYSTINGYKSVVIINGNSSSSDIQISSLAGFRTGGLNINSSGNVDVGNVYSFYSQGHSYSSNSGSGNNSYGLFLSESTGFINNYGIYQDDYNAMNILKGSLQVGDDFKISKLGNIWTINADSIYNSVNSLNINMGDYQFFQMGNISGNAINDLIIGYESYPTNISIFGNTSFIGDVDFTGGINFTGNVHINGTLTATVKSFVIDHPTKKDKKLQYGVLEGPEHSVYIRGKLKNENIITLPEYWVNLIHEDTITVNLTSIGNKQDLFVKKINSSFIEIYGDENIECFYTVFAERKDVEKLITEF